MTFDSDTTDTSTSDTSTLQSETEQAGTDTQSETNDSETDTSSHADTDTSTRTDIDSDTVTDTGSDTADTPDTETDTTESCPSIPTGTIMFEEFDDDISEWTFYGEVVSIGVSVSNQSFSGAWRGSTYYYTGLPDQAQAYVDFDADIGIGDHLLLEFWTNCETAPLGNCKTGGLVEKATFPWTNIGGYFVDAATGEGWAHHQVPIVADEDFIDTNRLTFRLGYPDQVIEVGGIRLTNYGQLATYPRPECLPDSTTLYSDAEITNEPRTIATIDFEYLYDIGINGQPQPTANVSGLLPGWLAFDADRNIFHGVPVYGDEGTTGDITVTVSNDVDSDMRTFAITVQVDPGLVGHWPLDEAAGTVVNDVSGNNYHGTLYGDELWDTSGGEIGGALTLDSLSGNVDYVELPIITELNDLQNVHSESRNYSIAAWVKPNGTPAAGDGYGIVQKAGFNTGIWFDENNCFNISHAFESSTLNAVSTTCGTDAWYHIALVFNNDYNNVNIYVNGTYEAAAFPSGSELDHDFATTPWRFGLADPSVSTMLGNITLDDVRIYNRLLNANEVSNLANRYSLFF